MLLRTKEVEPARQPCLTPTVPPPDQDARWIYSSGNPLQQGPASLGARGQAPTVTLSSFVWAQSDPNATPEQTTLDVIPLSPELKGEGVGGGGGAGDRGGEGKIQTDSTDRNNCGGAVASAVVGLSPAILRVPSRVNFRGGERNMKRCGSMGEARSRTKNRVSHNYLSSRGSEGRGEGYGQPLKTPWNPPPAVKERKSGAEFGFGGGGGLDVGVATGIMSPSNSSVSPWCRQPASPTEWGSPAGGMFNGQGRGVVGWADDAPRSNASN